MSWLFFLILFFLLPIMGANKMLPIKPYRALITLALVALIGLGVVRALLQNQERAILVERIRQVEMQKNLSGFDGGLSDLRLQLAEFDARGPASPWSIIWPGSYTPPQPRVVRAQLLPTPVTAEIPVAAAPSSETDQEKASPPKSDLPLTHPSEETLASDVEQEVAASKSLAEQHREILPAWVTHPPKSTESVYREVIEAGPIFVNDGSVDLTRHPAWIAIANCLSRDVGQPVSQHVLDSIESSDALLERFVKDRALQKRELSVGDAWMQYALVEIDADGRQFLEEGWRRVVAADRAQGVALVGAGVLGVIALALGLLKLDELTRGYYSGPLLLGVPATIILAALALVYLR